MSPTTHPAYGHDTLITTTTAAQMLGVSLPLFDEKFRPHLTVVELHNGAKRCHSLEVKELRDSLAGFTMDAVANGAWPVQRVDPLGPAKGIALALGVSLLAAGVVALAVYGIVRVVL